MILYKLFNGLGTFYVVADNPTEAQVMLEDELAAHGYGFSDARRTKEIYVVSYEIGINPFVFSDEKHLIVKGSVSNIKKPEDKK